MSLATDTSQVKAIITISRAASPHLSAQEHDAIYKAAYNNAFGVSIIKDITKRSSKPTMFTNYAIYNAPAAAATAARKAIEAAETRKSKHATSKAFIKYNRPFNITPFIAKHSAPLIIAKLEKLRTDDDRSLFETLHAMGVRSLMLPGTALE